MALHTELELYHDSLCYEVEPGEWISWLTAAFVKNIQSSHMESTSFIILNRFASLRTAVFRSKQQHTPLAEIRFSSSATILWMHEVIKAFHMIT